MQNERQNPEKVEWLSHPMTKKLLGALQRDYEAVKEDWANSQFVGDTPQEMVSRNAQALGAVSCLRSIIDAIEDTSPEAP